MRKVRSETLTTSTPSISLTDAMISWSCDSLAALTVMSRIRKSLPA
jgi:hypothetical protein